MNDQQQTGGTIAERFRLTGELRPPRKGEWYWWTGRYGPAACRAESDGPRPFAAPILVEREKADIGPVLDELLPVEGAD